MSTHRIRTRRLPAVCATVALLALQPLTAQPAVAASTSADINPDVSNNSDPDAATGGRVNGIGAVPGDNQTFYVASEFGGLFKTTNGGDAWTRLDDHLPTRGWDVQVDPSNVNRVFATSWYDGRATSLSGIQVSQDAGATWSKPGSATPPTTLPCANPRDEGRAYDIAVRPDAPANVYVGTSCGLAISSDSGATWTFVDADDAAGTADDVWDVAVQAGGPTGQGIIDVCGDERHFRSTDGGATWTGGSTGLPAGRCALDVSPDESYVLFVYAADNNIYESDDAGATWTQLGAPERRRQGRVPFVATNQRSDSGGNNVFDLWTSDVSLFRAGCTTPASPAPGGALRCPMAYPGSGAFGGIPNPYAVPAGWSGPFTRSVGAHDDGGDLVFDTEATSDACPVLYTSDGGAHKNTDTGSDCHNPDWLRSNVGLHAMWLWAMDGADVAGDVAEDLYFGTQDVGSFGTTNAGAATPTWNNADCCDVFDVAAQPGRVVYTTCCVVQSDGSFTSSILLAGAGISGQAAISPNPPGTLPTFQFPDYLDDFADKQYVAATGGTAGGVFTTTDITAGTVTWTALGAGSSPAGAFAVQAAVSGGTPTFYVSSTGNQVSKYVGTGSDTWDRIDDNDGLPGGLPLFAVRKSDPNRLAGATGNGFVFFSSDGGTTWDPDPELDALMIGDGAFKRRQPTLLAFDPEDADFVVAGGADSGVFLSTDGGDNWSVLTDPLTSNVSGVPHLPEPRYAYFDHESSGDVNIYIGTRGRGVWRFTVTVPTADAGGPYTTPEGTNVVLDASGSSDPDGAPLTYEWDLDDDGQFDDATGPAPTFDAVGQDGVYPVAVKVTAGGVADVASSTVTVTNVAPTVSGLASDSPVDEGSTVTVTGAISDPGWLDPLSATIDWGDGTPVQTIVGASFENDRPDATLTFSVGHVYGDNGTFHATVCGQDDDTETCAAPLAIQVNNVDPTSTIDESGTTSVNGTPTIIAHAGDPVTFSGRSTDPGSDDLTLTWDFGDGIGSASTSYLVNPPFADPAPSPSVQPRDVTDVQVYTYGDACVYVATFATADDDGGSSSDTVNVLITGNNDDGRQSGYWQRQYRRVGTSTFDDATLQCYLDITGYVSQVFHEVKDVSTFDQAHAVLFEQGTNVSKVDLLDRALLTAWLNFANGAVEYDELVDTDGDGVGDTAFATAMATAESVRLDPTSTDADLDSQREIVIRINDTI